MLAGPKRRYVRKQSNVLLFQRTRGPSHSGVRRHSYYYMPCDTGSARRDLLKKKKKKKKKNPRNGVIHHREVTKRERANEYSKLHSTERDFKRSIRSRDDINVILVIPLVVLRISAGCVSISHKLG